MYFKFKTKDNKEIKVFHNGFLADTRNNIYGTMSWDKLHNGSTHEIIENIHKDAKGRKYFNFEGEVIYTDEFIAYTPEQLVDKIKNSELRNSDELVYTLMRYGLDCVRVILLKKPMNGISLGDTFIGFESYVVGEDKSTWDKVEYKFNETELFKLHDNYKVRLTPANEEHRGVYASSDYYISDLVSLFMKCTDDYKLELNKAV